VLLNGIGIWRIGRQKDEFVSTFLKDPPGFLSFVKGGIVHDDQGAGLKLLQQLFLEVVVKNGGVQAPLKKEWGEEPLSLGGGRDEVRPRPASPAALPKDLSAGGPCVRAAGGALEPGLIKYNISIRSKQCLNQKYIIDEI